MKIQTQIKMHSRQILLHNHTISFMNQKELVLCDCLQDSLFYMAVLMKNAHDVHINDVGKGPTIQLTAYFEKNVSNKHFRHDITGDRIGKAIDLLTYQTIYMAINAIISSKKRRLIKASVLSTVDDFLTALDIPAECLDRDTLTRNILLKREKIRKWRNNSPVLKYILPPDDPKF